MANLASAGAYHFPSQRGIVLKHTCKDPNLIHGRMVKVLKVLQKENEFHLSRVESPLGLPLRRI